jgi:succinate dehydrogenase/fumarate reductase flavoprotein subunit
MDRIGAICGRDEQRTNYDVVVVGSGAAGLTAALTTRKLGLSVLIVEKESLFGGTSARSGGDNS